MLAKSSRRCFRHLDRPFVVLFGLGPVDLFAIVVATGVLMILSNPLFGIIGGLGFGIFVQKIKEGRPQGYAFYLLYRSGLIGWVPPALLPPGLVLPPSPGSTGVERILKFSAVAAEADDDSREAKFWLGSKGPKAIQ